MADRAAQTTGEVPLISVVVPSYNHAEYIGACLDSVYFQDYPKLEIIIVDDCSTDGSVAVIEQWLAGVEQDTASYASFYEEGSDEIKRMEHQRYPNEREVVFLRNTENMGSTRTYNRGFRHARGELCTFVASDDICHPQMLSTLAGPIIRDEADFVYADMFIVDDHMRILREFKLPDYSFERCFCDWYLCGVATLYRRDLHRRLGYYDETAMADDHECYLRFAMIGARFRHVAKTLYSKRSHRQRREGLHGSERFRALLEHSKQLTLRARAWLVAQGE